MTFFRKSVHRFLVHRSREERDQTPPIAGRQYESGEDEGRGENLDPMGPRIQKGNPILIMLLIDSRSDYLK